MNKKNLKKKNMIYEEAERISRGNKTKLEEVNEN
jgi:hypothetical protein